jgi:hypothetical protein
MASSALPQLVPTNSIDGTIGGRGSPSGLVRINCHDRPYLSWTQPYRSLNGYWSIGISTMPPSDNFSQTSSIFSLASFSRDGDGSKNNGSKLTMNDTDGLNLKSGPALIAINFCLHNSNETTSQSPEGVSWSVVTFVKQTVPWWVCPNGTDVRII